MAWMVSFALLGGLVFSILIAPVLPLFAFEHGASEWENPVMAWLTRHYRTAAKWTIEHRHVTLSCRGWRSSRSPSSSASAASSARSSYPISMKAPSGCAARSRPPPDPRRACASMNEARIRLNSFPEVTKVVSQTGRPDDGTDTTGFFNTEYFVDLKPKEEWRPVFKQNKDELIAAMDRELDKIPGVGWNFSQPISDNVEEAVSGVKGELAVKIYGDDLKTLEEKGNEIVTIMTPDSGRRRPRPVSRHRPAQPQLHRQPRSRSPLRHQRRRRAGRYPDRRWRQRRHPGAAGRCALRRRHPLSPAVPLDPGGHRQHPPARSQRRTRALAQLTTSRPRTAPRKSTAKPASATSPSSTACATATSALPSKRPSAR